MRASSQSMFGILNGFTLDPGISDQFTDISSIGIPNHLQRKTISTSKHHLHIYFMTDSVTEFFTGIRARTNRELKTKLVQSVSKMRDMNPSGFNGKRIEIFYTKLLGKSFQNSGYTEG